MGINLADIKVGDVVLLRGPHETWVGAYMRVDEIRGWGLIGEVCVPGRGMAPLRVATGEVAAVYRKLDEEEGR